MGWLLELLFGAVREMCSQFIVDMMDIASSMFTEILSCNLDLFEDLFGVAGDLYKNAVLPVAIALLLMILVWQLFKSMFGKLGAASEDPMELVLRSCFCLFMIAFAKNIVNYILDIVGTPYQWVVGTSITVDSFSQYVSAAEAVVSVLGIDAISIQMLMLVMQFVVAWNYFKMLFILAERYVLLGIFSYTSPLAFATGGSKATNNILASWSRMFGGQVLIVILDAWCVKMFLSGYGNLMASSYGFTKFFAATMCLIGFCKITAKLDSYMASLGVNLGRIGGGLSGLGALMMAGRLLHTGGWSGGKGGSDRGTAGHMSFGAGKPIPMSGKSPDFGGAGMDGMRAAGNFGIGGLEPEPFGGTESGMERENQQPGMEENFDAFAPEHQGIEDQSLPFGMPEESEGDIGGWESAEDLENAAKDWNQDGFTPFQEVGAPDMGEVAEMPPEAGEIPFMDGMEGSPSGLPFGEAEDIPGDMGPAEGADETVPGFSELGQENAMDMPGESGGIGGMQTEAGTWESQESGAGGEIGQAVGSLEDVPTSGFYPAASAGEDGVADSGLNGAGSAPGESVPAFSSGGYSQEGAESVGTAQTSLTDGRTEDSESSVYGQGSHYGQDNRNQGGIAAGAYGQAEAGSSIGKADTSAAVSGGVTQSSEYQGHENAGQGQGSLSGAYQVQRDGEPYMRYDAGLYEKPQGPYQTIHENGKTFYELPGQEKAPSILSQTRATLEKDGSLRLEKESREPAYREPDSRKPDFREQVPKTQPARTQVSGEQTPRREQTQEKALGREKKKKRERRGQRKGVPGKKPGGNQKP